MLGPFIYSYANAKARAIRAWRLTPEDWHILANMPDLGRVIQYLSTTSYSPFIASHTSSVYDSQQTSLAKNEYGGLFKKRLERVLYTRLMEDYAKIFRALGSRRRKELILSLYSRFDGQNLKILLRALFSMRTREEVEHLLFPQCGLSRIPWSDLWALDDISQVEARLGRSVFAQALRFAYPQFQAQGILFPLEIAVDHACFHWLRRSVAALSRGDYRAVHMVVGPFIDFVNISWIIRLRWSYGLQPEQVVNYSLAGGSLIKLKQIGPLSQAKDREEFISRLPARVRQHIQDATSLEEVTGYFRQLLADRVRRAFAGPPFNLGIEVACLLEEEAEIERLVSLVESKHDAGDLKYRSN